MRYLLALLLLASACWGQIAPYPSARRADSLRTIDMPPGESDIYVGGNQVLRSDVLDTFLTVRGDTIIVIKLKGVNGQWMRDSISGWRMSGTQFALGDNASYSTYGIHIGSNSGNNATNAPYSVFLGFYAGAGATNAEHSLFVGDYAGLDASGANNSNFIGRNAGEDAFAASYSNAMGAYAGSLTDGNFYNLFGYYAGSGNRITVDPTTGSYITAFGDSAGMVEDNSHVYLFGRKTNAGRDSQALFGGDIRYFSTEANGDTMTITHANDTTYFNTTAATFKFNKDLTYLYATARYDSSIVFNASSYEYSGSSALVDTSAFRNIWGDSLKAYSVQFSIKSPGTTAGADTFVVKDSASTDSIKIPVAFGVKWQYSLIGKRFPANALVRIILRKGGTTAMLKNYHISVYCGRKRTCP